MSPGERVPGIEGRPTLGASKSACWRFALIVAVAVAVALPVSFSQAVEEADGSTVIVPCPDGSDAECVDVSFMADEGETSRNQWIVSPGCLDFL